MKKTKKISAIKRISISTLSAILAVMVVISVSHDIPLSAGALMPTGADLDNTTQTGFKDLVAFQKAKWKEIAGSVFGSTITDFEKPPTKDEISTNAKCIVQQDNPYFNWAVNEVAGLPAWDGTEEEVVPEDETITYESDSFTGGDGNIISAKQASIAYKVYNVSNASQLSYAMNQAKVMRTTQNTKINLTEDINLNGTEKMWVPNVYSGMNKFFYIEGNGHTIYNMKCYNTEKSGNYGNGGFAGNFNAPNARLVMKNLNFSNCLSLSNGKYSTAVAVGFIACQSYLENINILDSFVFSNTDQTGTLIGRTETDRGNVFIRNCSSQHCYVYGNDHSGGLTGCQHNTGRSYSARYNAAFPNHPETWLAERSNQRYPEIVENCYSVDSTLFSVGKAGDSGGLLSCGGKLICRNSFTNNIVYGKSKTGAFFGRDVTPDSGSNPLYDDNKKRTVNVYFENCYASGTIEGIDKIGGFLGFDAGSDSASYGVAVYKNCYTTAMVGMDYAGSQLGGFIGHENTSVNQHPNIIIGKNEDGTSKYNTNSGAVYINCYAAGEVGNILTSTDTEQSGSNYKCLGGFLGYAGYNSKGGGSGNQPTIESGKNNGTYVNCYYDVQTTAMRERACGKADQFLELGAEPSQIPGVTPVYTQKSEKKGIEGLADSVDMGDDSAWMNGTKDDMYPALKALYDDTEIINNFGIGAAHYGTGVSEDDETYNRINATLNDKADTVKKYTAASLSTVLLDHWDITMNMNTGSIGAETRWKPGLPQNKLAKVEYAADDANKWKYDDDNMCWEIEYKNLASGEYEFKIQQGTGWAYNFGKNMFNGDNCKLVVPQDCNAKIRFDYVDSVSQLGVDTNFRIWAEYYNKDNGELISVQGLGENANASVQNIYTVAGSFGNIDPDANWNPAYKKFDMHYSSTSQFKLSTQIPKGSYSFKITKSNSWATSYGQSGTGGDMSFEISKDCTVTFIFDEETKLTTVTTEPQDALVSAKTEVEKIPFTGYSVIAADEAITGYKWLTGLDAAETGALKDEDGDGIYTATFKINRYKNDSEGNPDKSVDYFKDKLYGYKIIKDAVDEGRNYYFRIQSDDDSVKNIDLTFTYNPAIHSTNAEVTCSTGCTIDNNPSATKYGIYGTQALTGFNWTEGVTDADKDDTAKVKMIAEDDGKTFTKTYKNVPAGDHAFKVVGDCTFDSGLDYGANDASGDYKFTTKETSDITIRFNKETTRITVSTNPEDAVVQDKYVVSGNSYLTGFDKKVDSEENVMTFDDTRGVYTKTYDNLTSNIEIKDSEGNVTSYGTTKNYVFKVVKFGQNNMNDYIQFIIDGDGVKDDEKYKLIIEYDPATKKTEYRLYDSNDNDVTETSLKPPKISFYSVAGDKELTGYSWLEDTSSEAMAALKMDRDESGEWSKTFTNVPVSYVNNNLAFKVVADGTWAAGIDFGDPKGGNFVLTLASATVTSCNVTIKFNEKTQKITVTTSPDCEAKIDESQFEWFVCGDENIVSEDAYKAPKTIYDTVRDITHEFSFTADSDMIWEKEQSRNKENGFFEYLGGYADETKTKGKGFSLNYKVEGKTITGTFAEPVISLNTSTNDGKSVYTCSQFMPGKQWLEVTTGKGQSIEGNRYLRLIPTAYLEAGNDANIRVLQAASDTDAINAKNIVTYNKNKTDGITFTGLDDGNGKATLFKNYNFALTAGYAITDVNGIGYYGNYSNQNVQEFDDTKRRPNELNVSYADTSAPFVMTSVFAESANYNDSSKMEKLAIDTLVNQTLIGSSYSSDDDIAANKNVAKTIVKVFRLGKDDEGNTTETKIFMDSKASETSEYYTNYLKWTGQQPFSDSDTGEYKVQYYWSLADGRYLTDNKTVSIVSGESEIKKSVNTPYIEKSDNAEIEYTVTYTNRTEGNFTICDILPFEGDVRFDDSKENGISSSRFAENSKTTITLTEISVSSETADRDSASPVTVSYTPYYTTNIDVRSYLKNGEDLAENVASKVDVSDGKWSEIPENLGGGINNLTALAVTGTQTNAGTSKITIKYKLAVNSPSIKEYYVNNAFFKTKDVVAQETGFEDYYVNGYGNPVTTAVVAGGFSGFVWYDNNLNGKFDNGEPPVKGVKVTLYNKADDSETGLTTTTNADGYYCFESIPAGDDYQVRFSADESGNVTINGNEIAFDNLMLSRTLSRFQVTDKEDSRNIAKQLGTEDTNKQYYIDEALPTVENIFKNNNQQFYEEGSVNNYYFLRQFQNLGLREAINEKPCSITVKKVEGGTNNPLAGVKFKLEYLPADEENFKPVTYVIDADGNYKFTPATETGVSEADDIATDENGQFRFTNLPSNALYRLSEVSTLEDYNLLSTALEFALPYYIENGNKSPDGYVTGNDQNPEKGTYYYDVTYTVTNSKIPDMPLTGMDNNFLPLIIASVLFAAFCSVIIIYIIKKLRKNTK